MDDFVLVNKGASAPFQGFAPRVLRKITLENRVLTPIMMKLGICNRVYMTARAANKSGAKA